MDAPDWIQLGGWHPGYARVLAQQVTDDRAAALIDSNGDGVHLDSMTAVREVDGLWVEIEGGTDVGPHHVAEWESWRLAWGHDTPGTDVAVTFSQTVQRVQVPASGWWLLLQHDPHAWVEPEPARPLVIPPEHRGKAYASTLTITFDDGRVVTGDEARRRPDGVRGSAADVDQADRGTSA